MGFFGFGNYNKEGPGISKDAPKKRTFVVFFETFFRNFWKFAPISAIYTIFCLPIITHGLASVGMTNVARNTARDKHSFGISDFFETIKKNWKQALLAGIINTVVYGFLIYDVFFFFGSDSTFYSAALGIILSMLVIFTMMNYYIWTLMITFKFTLKQIYKNSFKFVFINMKGNLLCFFIEAVIIALYIGILFLFSSQFGLVLTLEMFAFVFTFPSVKFLLEQYIVFPAIKKHIIDPYYEAHPDEDIEKRRNLGLYNPEEDEEDEENAEDDDDRVFNDNIIDKDSI